jgi:hypothetical protein
VPEPLQLQARTNNGAKKDQSVVLQELPTKSLVVTRRYYKPHELRVRLLPESTKLQRTEAKRQAIELAGVACRN